MTHKCQTKDCKGEAKIHHGWCKKCKIEYAPKIKNVRGKQKLTIGQIQEKLIVMGKKKGLFPEGKLFPDKPDE